MILIRAGVRRGGGGGGCIGSGNLKIPGGDCGAVIIRAGMNI